MRLPRLLLGSLAAVALAAGFACSGDDETSTPAAVSATGTVAAGTVTPNAESTATPSAAATTTATGTADEPRAGSLSPLGKAQSFKYVVAVSFAPADASTPDAASQTGSLSLTGAYVAPDRSSFRLGLNVPGLPLNIEAVQIGEDAYTNLGGTWQKSAADDSNLVSGFLPTSEEFYEEFALADIGDLGDEFTVEEYNGRQVRHYTLDKEALAALAELAGERGAVNELLAADELVMDLYVADPEDFIVGLKFAGTASSSPLGALFEGTAEPDAKVKFELTMDITNIDDPTLTIEPPI